MGLWDMEETERERGRARARAHMGQLKNHMLCFFLTKLDFSYTLTPTCNLPNRTSKHSLPSQKELFLLQHMKLLEAFFSPLGGSLEHRIDSGSSRKFFHGYGAAGGRGVSLKSLCESLGVSQIILLICIPGMNQYPSELELVDTI